MERKRIIIADDESLLRNDLREMLTALGYLVIGEVGDGRSAVNLARELKPDVVIMDIRMPDMDGIEAARILTAEHIAPVLLLTAYGEKSLVERAKEAGVIGYMVKPFRDNDLAPAIEIALSRFAEFRLMEQEATDVKEVLETRKLIDRAKGILMDTQNIREAEAFRKIQKMSMDTRRPMKEIAQAIIITHEAGC
ncbi:MAG: response regulator [Chloroflexi bacterium]|nr:response regulator [Chloroflexota bacterium]